MQSGYNQPSQYEGAGEAPPPSYGMVTHHHQQQQPQPYTQPFNNQQPILNQAAYQQPQPQPHHAQPMYQPQQQQQQQYGYQQSSVLQGQPLPQQQQQQPMYYAQPVHIAPQPQYHPQPQPGLQQRGQGYGQHHQAAMRSRSFACAKCGALYELPSGATTWRCRMCRHFNSLGNDCCVIL